MSENLTQLRTLAAEREAELRLARKAERLAAERDGSRPENVAAYQRARRHTLDCERREQIARGRLIRAAGRTTALGEATRGALERVHSDCFAVVAQGETYATDASSLGRDFWPEPLPNGGIGFLLVDSDDGREVVYALVRQERDGEGELTCDVYHATDGDEPRVRIYND
jgi:hypothetical protein